jgi:hypothetical protein
MLSQIATWGHPATTGIFNVDYFITSDAFEGLGTSSSPLPSTSDNSSTHTSRLTSGPAASERFTEQLVRLDSLSFHFTEPAAASVAPLHAFAAKHGVPLNRPIVACPQVNDSHTWGRA